MKNDFKFPATDQVRADSGASTQATVESKGQTATTDPAQAVIAGSVQTFPLNPVQAFLVADYDFRRNLISDKIEFRERGTEVEEDDFAGILLRNGLQELVARHVGSRHDAILGLALQPLREDTRGVVESAKYGLEVGMNGLDGAVGLHPRVLHLLSEGLRFGEVAGHLIYLAVNLSVSLPIRQEFRLEGEVEAAAVAAELQLSGMGIYEGIGLLQVRQDAVGIRRRAVFPLKDIIVFYEGTQIRKVCHQREEVLLPASVV